MYESEYAELVTVAETRGASDAADVARLILANLYQNYYDGGRSASWPIVEPAVREAMEEASERHAEVPENELRAARATLGHPMGLSRLVSSLANELETDQSLSGDDALARARATMSDRLIRTSEAAENIALAVALTMFLGGFFAPLTALLFREGPLHRLAGIEIQDRLGRRVSRLRAFARAMIAWTPVFVVVGMLLVIPEGEIFDAVGGLAIVSMALLMLAGAVYQVLRPARGFQDHLAGTYLVPR